MSVLAPTRATYTQRRERGRELASAHPFAREVLAFYLALLPAQEEIASLAASAKPGWADLPGFVALEAMPRITAVSLASGPELLRGTLRSLVYGGDLEGLAADWLRGGGDPADEMPPAERFLARTACEPVLEALPELVPAPRRPTSLTCPACGALPQVSYFAASGESLVTGQRHLACSRCAHDWLFPRMVCASCGESETARLPIFADHRQLPHLRVDACEGCRRFLVTVDVAKDPRAIPLVDELAAIPLVLYAEERGLKKVTPNLMGL